MASNYSKELKTDFYGITIDPGIHTAIAFWRGRELYKIITLNFIGSNDSEYIKDMCSKLGQFSFFGIDHTAVIEDVRLFTSSATSMASGARGNLITLAKIAGVMGFWCSLRGFKVEYVLPQTWKGQLNYKQLRSILKLKFNFIAKNDHEAAAYGIGLWKLDLFH